MIIKRMLTATLAAVVIIGAVGSIAQAQSWDQDSLNPTALASMKVMLQQAITEAESQAGGRAVGIEVSQEQGATCIWVDVVGPQGVKTVVVDGATSQVTAIRDSDRGYND